MMVHFLWIGSELKMIYSDYLAIKTAKAHSDNIVLWTQDIIKNEIYDMIDAEFDIRTFPGDVFTEAKTIFENRGNPFSGDVYRNMCDYIRYYLLYEYGGLFLDLDTVSNKSIDKIGREKPILVGTSSQWINGAIMWAEKGLPIFQEAMDKASEIAENPRYAPMGPLYLTQIAKSHNDLFQIVPQRYFQHFHYRDWERWFTESDMDLTDIYIAHLFGRFSREFCQENITPEFIRKSQSLYARIVRSTLWGRLV